MHALAQPLLFAVVAFSRALACASASDLPRVESGGRVVVLDDSESGPDAWEGDARVELGPGKTPGTHSLV